MTTERQSSVESSSPVESGVVAGPVEGQDGLALIVAERPPGRCSMADDPRIEPAEEYIRLQFGVDAGQANLVAWALIGEADVHDPLRVLIADEDRAVGRLSAAVYNDSGVVGPVTALKAAHAVLAALREEARL